MAYLEEMAHQQIAFFKGRTASDASSQSNSTRPSGGQGNQAVGGQQSSSNPGSTQIRRRRLSREGLTQMYQAACGHSGGMSSSGSPSSPSAPLQRRATLKSGSPTSALQAEVARAAGGGVGVGRANTDAAARDVRKQRHNSDSELYIDPSISAPPRVGSRSGTPPVDAAGNQQAQQMPGNFRHRRFSSPSALSKMFMAEMGLGGSSTEAGGGGGGGGSFDSKREQNRTSGGGEGQQATVLGSDMWTPYSMQGSGGAAAGGGGGGDPGSDLAAAAAAAVAAICGQSSASDHPGNRIDRNNSPPTSLPPSPAPIRPYEQPNTVPTWGDEEEEEVFTSRPRQESPLQDHAYPFRENKGSPLALEGGASPLTDLPLAEAERGGDSPESSPGGSFRMGGLFRRNKGSEGSPSALRRSEASKAPR